MLHLCYTISIKLKSCRTRTHPEHHERVSEIPHSQVVLAIFYLEIWLPRLAHQLTLARSGMLVSLVRCSCERCSHFGAALADADPLGVNQNVTFNEVGGLDDRLSLYRSILNAS